MKFAANLSKMAISDLNNLVQIMENELQNKDKTNFASGAFGKIFKANFNGKQVAIKVPKDKDKVL